MKTSVAWPKAHLHEQDLFNHNALCNPPYQAMELRQSQMNNPCNLKECRWFKSPDTDKLSIFLVSYMHVKYSAQCSSVREHVPYDLKPHTTFKLS